MDALISRVKASEVRAISRTHDISSIQHISLAMVLLVSCDASEEVDNSKNSQSPVQPMGLLRTVCRNERETSMKLTFEERRAL
jgi:hypothetical protein